MESPLDVSGVVTALTSRPDQDSEARGGEPRYAGIQLEQEQESRVATPASRNYESDTDSGEHDKGRSARVSASRNDESDRDTDSSEGDKERKAPISTSWNEESSTDSGEHNEGRNSPIPISRNEESETDSNSSSDGDLEIEQGYVAHKNDSSAEALDEKTLVEEEEGERDGNVYFQKEQSSSKALADEQCEPSSLFDWVIEESVEIFPEIAESNKQILDNTVGTPSSPTEEGSEKDKRMSLQSLNAPTEEESKPSSSQVKAARDIGSELVEFDEPVGLDDFTKAEGDYVKKGFTCDGNTEEEDEQLREYWTRALQTGTSTGQVVEEIVKVLKHHQKTHDLLCPVCGSCVTRRVILRKRKRSSLISVDRWYRDPLDEGEVREPVSSTEVIEPVEEEDPQDTKAFGCLACFSLFFEKGYLLLNQLQADIGSDTFNCLPFFFPPYPWGMTQMKPRSPGLGEEVLDLEEIVQSEEPSSSNVITCNIGSALLPDYPWGTMPVLLKGLHEEGSSLQEVEQAAVLDVQESVMADVESDVTCGIGSTLLPDYQWGTMPRLSKGDVIQPANQTDTAIGVSSSGQDVEQAGDVPQCEDIEESSQLLIDKRICTCGLAPALIPAYPWGYCAKSEGEQVQGSEDAGALSHPVEEPKPSISESTCTCGLAPALIPDYPWGYLSKSEEVALQSPSDLEAGLKDSSSIVVEDTNLQSMSQPESSEEPPQLCREGRNCTCGLVPALLPDYPWGIFAKEEDNDARIQPQAKTVEETEGKTAEDIGTSCDLVSTVLPDYPWGITTESEEALEEVPVLSEESNARRERLSFGTGVRVGSAVLPSYPWGVCSVNHSVHEQNGNAQVHQEPADRDCTCGMGLTMLPKFPWGQTMSTVCVAVDTQDQTERKQVKYYVEQETKQETRITSTTDVFIVTTSELAHPGLRPPQNIKTKIPQQASHTVQHVKLDQTVTIINAAAKVDEVPAIKGSPLASLPSTGFALLEEGLEGSLETRPSTGYAYLEELSEEAEFNGKDTAKTQKHPESEIEEDTSFLFKSRPQFPSFQWTVAKSDTGDLTKPLLKVEPDEETFVSVLKPSPGGVDEPKSESWLSVFKVSKPSGDVTVPLLPATPGYVEEIEEVKRPSFRPQIQSVTEAVLDVLPGDLGGTSVGTTPETAVALPTKKKKEAEEWDILKSIVFGGLEISIASLGVTSSAAGGNAITRTVVYMGIATLLSGFIGFYHNVLNLYHYHKDHYTDVVGVSLMLHGTVALISYVVFGLLSPLLYAFSYRATDNRDDKFILCCGVTIVAVTALALGKARVSNKRYLRTLFAYLSGGVLAAIVGYLTGEHVAELLEEWGI